VWVKGSHVRVAGAGRRKGRGPRATRCRVAGGRGMRASQVWVKGLNARGQRGMLKPAARAVSWRHRFRPAGRARPIARRTCSSPPRAAPRAPARSCASPRRAAARGRRTRSPAGAGQTRSARRRARRRAGPGTGRAAARGARRGGRSSRAAGPRRTRGLRPGGLRAGGARSTRGPRGGKRAQAGPAAGAALFRRQGCMPAHRPAQARPGPHPLPPAAAAPSKKSSTRCTGATSPRPPRAAPSRSMSRWGVGGGGRRAEGVPGRRLQAQKQELGRRVPGRSSSRRHRRRGAARGCCHDGRRPPHPQTPHLQLHARQRAARRGVVRPVRRAHRDDERRVAPRGGALAAASVGWDKASAGVWTERGAVPERRAAALHVTGRPSRSATPSPAPTHRPTPP
jgi:hypothetical protein